MTIIILSLFFIIIIYLIIYAYIKTTYKFWAYQPVFHVYNIFYWFFPPGIIDPNLPEKNKFTNTNNIITTHDMDDTNYDESLKLIQNHFFKQKKSQFNPLINNFKPYFIGHYDKCFFSSYYKDTYITEDNNIIEDKKLIGFMTSRPLRAFINNNLLNVYYVDYLCVDKEHRKSGIAPEIIQTHIYNSRNKNNNISVQLFKRDADLTGIVPITIYYNYVFDILKWNKPLKTNPNFKVIHLNSSNFHILYELIKDNLKHIFNIFIIPEYTHILELSKTSNIYIFCSMINKTIIGFYFFRDSCTIYKNFNVFECFASVCINQKFQKDFIIGFHYAMFNCFKMKNFKFLHIENVSHNYLIIKEILKSKKPVMTIPSAFYFYNFAYTPVLPHNFFAIY